MRTSQRNTHFSLHATSSIVLIAIMILSMGHYTQLNQASTGAPGETTCTTCHINPSPFIAGGVVLDGLSQYVVGGQPYQVDMKVYTNNTNAITAGFQMTLLNINGTSHGQLSDDGTNVDFKTFGGRNYAQHAPGVLFNQGGVEDTASFQFEWTPDDVTVNTVVRYFYVGLLGDGGYQPGSDARNDVVFPNNDNLTVVPELAASISVLAEPLCFEGTQGRLRVTSTGGLAPVQFLWSNGETSSVISDLSAGTYTVTVTDAMGQMTIRSQTLDEPDEIVINFEKDEPLCFGSMDGSVLAEVTGGTGAYSYLWSNGSTTNPLQNIGEGIYTATVTDENFCTKTETITVRDPEPIEIEPDVTSPSCHGLADGSIHLNTIGGISPYSYAWSTGATTNPVTGIAEGMYGTTVTDIHQCTQSLVITVTQPEPVEVELVAVEHQTMTENGSIVIEVDGGTPPYAFHWEGPNGFNSAQQNPTDLAAGSYRVTVTDMNNCDERLTAEVEFISAVDDPSADMPGIIILPNPGARLSIQFPEGAASEWTIQMIAPSGQLVYRDIITNTSVWNHPQASKLISGLYLVSLSNDSGASVSFRWMKIDQ